MEFPNTTLGKVLNHSYTEFLYPYNGKEMLSNSLCWQSIKGDVDPYVPRIFRDSMTVCYHYHSFQERTKLSFSFTSVGKQQKEENDSFLHTDQAYQTPFL